MALTAYKPGRGVYARGAGGTALLLLSLFASVRLAEMIGLETAFFVLGLRVPYGALWGAGLFVVLGALITVFSLGLQTGWAGLDAKARVFVDLLIDTEAELQKVSWPDAEELRRSTIVVLLCIVVLAGYLYAVDFIVSSAMSGLEVLPR